MKDLFRRLTACFLMVLIIPFPVHQATSQQNSIRGANAMAAVPAFPGAEGFGANTLGGRGGRIIEVTNLNDTGSGSLRACVDASGARICVFRTGGLIQLASPLRIVNPYITIAGQTAPGGGITLKKISGGDTLAIVTHDVVLRYMTFRPGPGGENHAGEIASNGVHLYNILIDHCSFSWGTDEVLETWYRVSDTTIQWSIVSEGLNCSTHSKGCHSKGLMVGGYADSESKTALGSENISVHHNLFAHNGERNPLIQTSGLVDVVNNVSYNPFGVFMYLYMKSNSVVPVNFVGNYYKYGPNTSAGKYEIKTYDDGGAGAQVYVASNIGPHRTSDSQAQNIVVDPESRGYLTQTRFAAPAVTTTSASQAYDQVLAGSGNNAGLDCDGSWVLRRDAIDARVVNDVRNRTGGIIDDPSQVGGWITPASGTPCQDSDLDGMPDLWETDHGLDPNNGSDAAADRDGDGYPNIEEYINGVGQAFLPSPPGPAELVAPVGSIGSNYTPSFTWNEIADSTWYYLWVNGPSGAVIKQWYEASNVCNAGSCTVVSPVTLGGGNHTWWIQTWNSGGLGPWSDAMSFSTTIQLPPPAATLVSPRAGIGAKYNPTYTWNQVSGATWYYLWVNGPGGVVIQQWYTSAQANCNGTTCFVTPSTTLGGGDHTWWIETWNSAGTGPWSSAMSFSTTVLTPPAAATLVSPTSGRVSTSTPAYTWKPVSNSTWYYLWVNGPNGTLIRQWYTSAQANCNRTTCSATPTTALSGGTYTWWIQTWNPAGTGPWSAAGTFSR